MTRTVESQSRRQKMAEAAQAVERLANSDVAREKFFRKLLQHLVEATQAVAGAVWLLDENHVLSLQSEQQIDALELDRNSDANRLRVQYLLDVLQRDEMSCWVPDDHALPVKQSLLIVPIHHNDQSTGLVELFLDGKTETDSLREILDFVPDVIAFASRYLAWHEESHSSDSRLQFWTQFEQVLNELHSTLRSRDVTATASNEGRRLMECDRFSVLARRGGRMHVLSVSGQGRINPRSNLIRSMLKLAAPVVASAEPIDYDGQSMEYPPQIAAPLVDYLKESNARSVLVIPLVPSTGNENKNSKPGKKPSRPLGVCVIEWFDQAGLSPLKKQQAESFCAHVTSALANARTHERVFLLPLRRILGGFFGWFQGRRFATAFAISVLLELAVFALVITPAHYRVEATGKIMPVAQRDIFAPWDGEIVEIFVEGGQQVTQGQQLLILRNDELEQTLLSLKNRLGERLQLKDLLRVQLGDVGSRGNRQEEIQIRGKQAQTETEIRGISERIAATEKQIDSLVVRSPMAGTVATFQLNQLLRNRPATRGEVLLQVMDESQNWRLELDVPEHRLGILMHAKDKQNDSTLPVEFVLATAPEQQYPGTLTGTATRIQLSSENEAVLPVLVQLNRDDVPLRRIGAKVKAKIDCGERSLFYVLFGDVVEFVQRHVW